MELPWSYQYQIGSSNWRYYANRICAAVNLVKLSMQNTSTAELSANNYRLRRCIEQVFITTKQVVTAKWQHEQQTAGDIAAEQALHLHFQCSSTSTLLQFYTAVIVVLQSSTHVLVQKSYTLECEDSSNLTKYKSNRILLGRYYRAWEL